jgi:hypothetical protein
MNKYSLAAILGGAILSAATLSANPTPFNFQGNNTTDTENGVTATLYAFDVQGTSTGPGSGTSNKFTSAAIGTYGTNGLGICETTTVPGGQDCNSPNHQINNGADVNTAGGGGNGPTTNPDYFEFMLFQFTNASTHLDAAVTLASMGLGNYGSTGTTNPFNATYWTTSSTASLTTIVNALEATTVGGLAGTDGFSTLQTTTCVTGTGSNCGINSGAQALDALTGSNVTYLLVGASTTDVGNDFFKLQALNISGYNANFSSSTPEPATFGLIGLALAGLGIYGRKRKS